MRRHQPLSGGSGGGGQRSGIVRPQGRAVEDATGAFYPLGLSFFWSMQGAKHERERYLENVAWSASHGFDFHRLFTEVAWEGHLRIDPTLPEWADWHDILRFVIDECYERGLRSQLTLRGKGTSVNHLWLAAEVGKIITAGRAHKVILCEMENEFSNGGDPLSELSDMAQELDHLPNMLALSAPAAGNADEAELVKWESRQIGLESFPRHLERGGGDWKWRQVRQAWDFHNDAPFVGWNNEPPGPASSVETNTSPLQLAMMRAVSIMCGAPGFVLHTGTGVYGDGKPGSTGPRPPNFWEIDNIDAIVSAVRGIDALLPAGLPNWTAANTQWEAPAPVAPFQPHDHWEGDAEKTGVNKAYAALAPDGRVIQMPCGVRGFVRLTASYALQDLVVYDPLSLQPVAGVPQRVANGEAIELPGGGEDAMVAYIIHGRRA